MNEKVTARAPRTPPERLEARDGDVLDKASGEIVAAAWAFVNGPCGADVIAAELVHRYNDAPALRAALASILPAAEAYERLVAASGAPGSHGFRYQGLAEARAILSSTESRPPAEGADANA